MLESDPIDLALGADGDLMLNADSDLALSSGITGVAQACRLALELVRGEWFANLDDGVPYFEREGVAAEEAVLGQKFNAVRAVSIFQEALRTVAGVVEITSLTAEFNPATREMRVSWTVRTEFGDTPPDSLSLGV